MATQQNFDFQAHNTLVQNAPAGLKVFLCQQMLAQAVFTMEMYENPRAEELRAILTDLKVLRAAMKQDAADRLARS